MLSYEDFKFNGNNDIRPLTPSNLEGELKIEDGNGELLRLKLTFPLFFS